VRELPVTMATEDPLKLLEQIIEGSACEFEKNLAHSLGSAMAVAVRGGKRLRARCVLVVVDAHHKSKNSRTGLYVATALEFLHAATCVIDDMHLFDDSLTRRGVPSVPSKFGPSVAVLAAGNLLVHVMSMVIREPEICIDRLCRMQAAITTTCDLTAEGQLSEECGDGDALSVARRKTGALFGLACALGGILSGVDLIGVARLQTQGEALGVLLQMVDDGEDIEEDRARGRPGNNTLLSLGVDEYLVQAKLHYNVAQECEGLSTMASELYTKCRNVAVMRGV